MLRFRGKKILKTVRQLDVFPKVNSTYVRSSRIGGFISIVGTIVIVWLTYAELSYYLDSKFSYKFVPDVDFNEKLTINVDLTVAMSCINIGADIVDSTNQQMFKFGTLEEEDTWFELDEDQQRYVDSMRMYNSFLTESYHSIQNLIWKHWYTKTYRGIPERKVKPDRPTDACRVHGSLTLNKVSGNFHITAGKSLSLPGGHIHISAFMTNSNHNFSHRIDRLSFGEFGHGMVNPLDGDYKVTDESSTLYQYFVEVVPTDVSTLRTKVQTYQYSVKELERTIDHDAGSHGVPGIFFKYDTNALKVIVHEENDSFPSFFVRLAATMAGIFILCGVLKDIVESVLSSCCPKQQTVPVESHETVKIIEVPVQVASIVQDLNDKFSS